MLNANRFLNIRTVLFACICLFIMALLGCDQHKEKKEQFKQYVHSILKNGKKGKPDDIDLNVEKYAITTLEDLFPFVWTKACFGSGPWLNITFIDEQTKNEMLIEFEEGFNIRDDYVRGSPDGRCFERSQPAIVYQIKQVDTDWLVFLNVIEADQCAHLQHIYGGVDGFKLPPHCDKNLESENGE